MVCLPVGPIQTTRHRRKEVEALTHFTLIPYGPRLTAVFLAR
jgi:hypothetical protein